MAESKPNSIALDPELIQDFINESLESLETVAGKFIELEKNPEDIGLIDSVFRAIHSIKGNSSYFNWTHVKVFAHNLENVLDDLRSKKRPATPDVIDALMTGTNFLKEMMVRTSKDPSVNDLNDQEKDFLQTLEKIAYNITNIEDSLKKFFEVFESTLHKVESQGDVSGEVLLSKMKALLHDQQIKIGLLNKNMAPSESQPNPSASAPKKETVKAETSDPAVSTIRVKVEKVDEFMNYVGELIIMSDLFNGVQKNLEKSNVDQALIEDFKQAYLSFEKLSTDLQKSLMEVRKIPVQTVLQKIPRITRDLARQQGKEIEVEISGSEILIDKSLVESLEAPIVHMVRNAVDHGLELPADRTAVGKLAKGTLRVSARVDHEMFVLVIKDDGKGISPDQMRQVAIKKGFMTSDQVKNLTDSEALNLIFRPGFSSKEAVTDVSGRGVGMDVVLKNVQKCKGTIDVQSVAGKGTDIAIKIPLRSVLMVESGLMVRVQNERYVFPLDTVKEVLPLKKETEITHLGEAQVVRVRNILYPLVWLEKMLGTMNAKFLGTEKQLIVAEAFKQKCCFVVDEIIGNRQVVIREMKEGINSSGIIKGIAILGHSKPVIVLDIGTIIRRLPQFEKLKAQPTVKKNMIYPIMKKEGVLL